MSDVTRPTTVEPTDQRAAWNGPEGANWAAYSEARLADRGQLAGHIDSGHVSDLLAAADLSAAARVLDIGCGTGELTRRAARIAVAASATGVDLSELMVAQARRTARAEHVDNAYFEVGDVATHPFEPASFDVALSHFGVMFFADPVAAFANVARALHPGGRLLFACPAQMDRCDWYGIPLAALFGHRPTDAEAPSVMFSLSTPGVVTDVLASAGFTGIRIEPLEGTFWFGSDPGTAADMLLGAGPVQAFLQRNPSMPADAAHAALAAAVAPHLGPDGVRLPGTHWLVAAERQAGVA